MVKPRPRNNTRYIVKLGNKIVHGGITERPLGERAKEHIATFGPKIKIVKIGPKVTKHTALKWEKERGYS